MRYSRCIEKTNKIGEKMAEENIQIIVHDDGRIEFRTHDIKGEACMEELEEILGELVDDLESTENNVRIP